MGRGSYPSAGKQSLYSTAPADKEMDGLVVIGDFDFEGILSVLPCLSLFTLVFICIFVVWLMGSCDFCFSCSGLMGDRFFSLSLMFYG